MAEVISVLAVLVIGLLCGYVYGWQACDDYRLEGDREDNDA